jgi:uncharacterized protein
MSANASTIGRKDGTFEREPAGRIFARELRDCRYQYPKGDEERSPTYFLLPTGERYNRIFFVGTLIEMHRKDDGEKKIYTGRVVDSTDTFFIKAGKFEKDDVKIELAKIEPPAFVAVVGKPNIYQTPDGAFLVSVRIESITVVDKETRDLWVLDAARQTLNRLDAYKVGTTPDIVTAKEKYPNMDPAVFRKIVYDALAQIKI